MTSNVYPLASYRTSLYSRMIFRVALFMIVLQLHVALAQTSLPLPSITSSPDLDCTNSTNQDYSSCSSSLSSSSSLATTTTTTESAEESESSSILSTTSTTATSNSHLPTSLSVSASSAPSNTPRLTPTPFAPQPSVNTTGFDYGNTGPSKSEESWLKKNNRFIFVIVLGVVVGGLIIWYIVRSVQGMRRRLEQENHAQMLMLQQAQAGRNDHHHRGIPEESFNGYKMELSSSTIPSSPASPLAPVHHAVPSHH
ncbi:hypothetical protein F4703DRAFT_1892444 [Phycomyces blakesleeanus]